MGLKTGIEWTDATWNPVTGCTRVTSGCDHCYAETLARRRLHDVYVRRLPIVDTRENRLDAFAVRLWPERLDHPRKWAAPRMVFVNSFSDKDRGVTRHPLNKDWPLEMLTTIEFAEDKGKTTVTVRWSPLNATEAERNTFNSNRDGMKQGWTGTFEKLEAYLPKIKGEK